MSLRSLTARIHQYLMGFWANRRMARFRQKWLKRRLEEKYKVKISESMIERALRCLRETIGLRTILHGRKGCEFLPPEPAAVPAAMQLCLCFDGDLDGDSSAASLLSEVPSETGRVECTVAEEAPPEKQAPQNQPRQIPERIWAVVRSAWGRIKRAKHPDRYQQAIINSELRLEQRRMETAKQRAKKHEPEPPKSVAWQRITGEPWTWPAEELDEHGIPLNWKPIPVFDLATVLPKVVLDF